MSVGLEIPKKNRLGGVLLSVQESIKIGWVGTIVGSEIQKNIGWLGTTVGTEMQKNWLLWTVGSEM